ncbi:general stress protein [Paenibacillus sp. LHD-117]|uniref:general stress protein n=1 Tax=Paenibacillus sp. LHD-117 TaxID=3071412 RepID=UPI0027E13380|nr:general stress protein [Paenibacillus sp. LHD-117]MDQ6420075.1 general stress protein [Paenibacillus sp. LHD-117]
MARKIGIFESQQQVIDAITQLENSGFKPGEMMILAKDSEHSRRIEAETDVHADEMRDLEETRYDARTHTGTFGTAYSSGIGEAPVATAYGFTGFGGGTTSGVGFPFAVSYAFIGNEHERAFRSLGLDNKEAELCCQEVERGAYALIVETTESKSLLDKDGGPDLSTLGVAEAVFRSCGASRIANGS